MRLLREVARVLREAGVEHAVIGATAASPTRIGDTEMPLVAAADLVLLKLYAGGPQDAWDIDQLLDVDAGLAGGVEAKLAALPEDGVALWRRILEQRRR